MSRDLHGDRSHQIFVSFITIFYTLSLPSLLFSISSMSSVHLILPPLTQRISPPPSLWNVHKIATQKLHIVRPSPSFSTRAVTHRSTYNDSFSLSTHSTALHHTTPPPPLRMCQFNDITTKCPDDNLLELSVSLCVHPV